MEYKEIRDKLVPGHTVIKAVFRSLAHNGRITVRFGVVEKITDEILQIDIGDGGYTFIITDDGLAKEPVDFQIIPVRHVLRGFAALLNSFVTRTGPRNDEFFSLEG